VGDVLLNVGGLRLRGVSVIFSSLSGTRVCRLSSPMTCPTMFYGLLPRPVPGYELISQAGEVLRGGQTPFLNGAAPGASGLGGRGQPGCLNVRRILHLIR